MTKLFTVKKMTSTDTVIPNAEVREAARDLIESLKADGYPDKSLLAELQQLADGQPMPKEVKQ